MRPADAHLTPQEFELLLFDAADSNNSNATGASMPEAQQHLSECAVCQSVAERYRNAEEALRSLESGNKVSLNKSRGHEPLRGPDCPIDATWLSLATGLMEKDEASRYVTHAATCDWCGPLLKESMEDLAQDVTPEEQETLAKLPTASLVWQREMGRKLAARSAGTGPAATASKKEKRGAKKLKKASSGWWPKFVWAGSVAAVAAAVWVGVMLTREPDVNQLLAQAYSEQRTIELRMPGAAYGPMRVERGSGDHDLPAEFYRAKDIIKTESAKHPEDAAWLQALARADLLQWRYEEAIKELEDALMLKPNDPGLLLDKATALFERAQKIGLPASIDYGEAAETLSLVLKHDPDDPIALFNRAIVYEKLNLPNEAIGDLEHYLNVDANGSWAGEARDRLQLLRKMVRAHKEAMAESLADPDTFVRLAAEPVGVERIDKRIDEYQELAIKVWLPVAFAPGGDPDRRKQLFAALSALASMLSDRHQDQWMKDLLHSPRAPESYEAFLLLKNAVSLTSGDAMGAYAAASKSAHLFELAGNNAGLLRARLEQIHALQRAQQGVRCLKESNLLASRLRSSLYSWIRIQSRIDRCGCSSKVGDFEAAMAYVAAATREARTFQFSTLQLRSLGLSAAIQVRKGNMSSGWAGNQQGLGDYWRQPYIVPLRAQQFYDASVYAAEDLGYHAVARAFAAEDVRAAAASSYPSIEALTRSHLGKLEMRLGELDSAARELELAHSLLTSLPPTLATRAYVADAEIDLAELELLRGEPEKARKRMEELKPSLKGIASFPIPLRFYRTYAKTLETSRETSATEAAFEQAKEIAAANLQQLTDPSGRYSWMQETSALFRDFVQFEILRGNAEGALANWEWYRAAALNRSVISLAPSSQLHRILPRLKDQTVLSYALLPRGLAVWAFDERGVYSKFINLSPAELVARTRHFLQICGDPQSSLQTVESQARALYGMFIAPIEDRLVRGRLLVIEADEELGDIPFQAFQDRAGSYITDSYPLTYSQGIFYRAEAESATVVTSMSEALVVASSAILAGSDSETGVASEVEREAEVVADHFARNRILSGVRATADNLEALLPQAEVFHYGGHAVATTQEEGLVLPGPQQKRAAVWSASSDASRLFRKCKLVVLAACSTGTSRRGIKETHGRLVQTMIASGVSHVIASQWNVDSVATAEFMKLFYAALLRDHDVAVAIKEARRNIRRQPRSGHPYYWAAFVVFGHGKNQKAG